MRALAGEQGLQFNLPFFSLHCRGNQLFLKLHFFKFIKLQIAVDFAKTSMLDIKMKMLFIDLPCACSGCLIIGGSI